MRQNKFVRFLLLASCTTLQADEKPSSRDSKRPAHLLVVLIGGVDSDPSPAQIAKTAARHEGNSGLYRCAGDIAGNRVLPEYFNWNGTRAGQIKDKVPPKSRGIAEFIRAHLQNFPGDRVAIVGNSWGAHTAAGRFYKDLSTGGEDAAGGRSAWVFLDPSSTGRGPARPKVLPICANRAVNYFTRNSFVWGNWDAGPRLTNVDLGDPAAGYMTRGTPAYNSTFNLQAHIAAEWDENIHKDILARLREVLAADEQSVR